MHNQKSNRKVSFTSSVGTGFSFTTTSPLPWHQAVIYATLAASYTKHHLSQTTNQRHRKLIKSSSFTAKRLAFHLILCPCPRLPSTSDSRIRGSCIQTGNISGPKMCNTGVYPVVPCLPTRPLSFLYHNTVLISIFGTKWRKNISVIYIHIYLKVAGSIPAGVIGNFHWNKTSHRTMALGSTQLLTQMSIRNISWG